MQSPDGRFVLTYNGEVYNHTQLREELRDGWEFRGRSDTEVVLAGLIRWGASAVRRFNGMYAFALWDAAKQELLLGRDPIGIKPLYYANQQGRFSFGSEVKALLPVRKDWYVDHPSLHEFMFFGAPLGRNSLYQGIWQLLPGEMLRYRATEEQFERWEEIDLIAPSAQSDIRLSTVEIRTKIEAAVTSQMVADVPVGVLLSGGLDSSAITAFASNYGRRTISTFSLGFSDSPLSSELPKARAVAKCFRTEHHEAVIGSSDVLPILERMVRVYDGPFADAANLPLFLLYSRLGTRFKVMLQGDGGDEVFAGYRRYMALAWLRYWRLIAKPTEIIRTGLGERSSLAFSRFARFVAAITNDDPAMRMAYLLTMETSNPSPLRLLSPGLRFELRKHDPFERYRKIEAEYRGLDPVQSMLFTDCRILLPDIFLVKVDRASMAHGVEVRVPLLDLELMRSILPLPSSRKIHGTTSKHLFRQALKGVLPREILHQGKAGFGVPFGDWLKTGLRTLMCDVLLDDQIKNFDVFDRPALELCIKQHINGERDAGFLLWKMLNLALWLNRTPGLKLR